VVVNKGGMMCVEHMYIYIYIYIYIQPIADRVALNLEIIFETFSTTQNSAHGIYD